MKGARICVCVLAMMAAVAPAALAEAAVPKIVVIVFENKAYTKIVGSTSAPYMNALIGQGRLFTDYHAQISGSPRDYRAMTAGVTAKVSPLPANVFRTLDQRSMPWKEFEESMAGTCGLQTQAKVPGSTVQLYTRGHDPAYMYKGNESCVTNDVPLTSDAQLTGLPAFTYIVPNQCSNMHTYATTGPCPAYFGPVAGDNSVRTGDNWLAHVVPVLLADPDVTVIVTFDEGSDSSAQRVYTVEVGAGITPGSIDAGRYDHYGLLAGVYAGLQLGTAPNGGASATPLPIVSPRDALAVTIGGGGSGTVTSDPSGIGCGTGQSGTCTSTFVRGTSVALAAAPAAGSLVGSWSGPCGSVVVNGDGSSTCTVAAIASATAVSVSFDVAPPTQSFTVSGLRSVTTEAVVAQEFRRVQAVTAGDSLLVTFVERGLDPGQNYAYTGSGTVRETFQCYRSSTFTPLPKTKTIGADAAPDPRAYTADTDGRVKGFIYLNPGIVWPSFCGPRQEVVPVHVCYMPSDLLDFVQPFDVYYFAEGTEVCGAIEPD